MMNHQDVIVAKQAEAGTDYADYPNAEYYITFSDDSIHIQLNRTVFLLLIPP